MGVTGLWRLIEPVGKPVPVETLENKVLAVDISIWLHQMVKGYQDAKGAPLPNAHLMGLFQRLCKLLYFRIKPVFVFDGGFPELKKETIAKRQDHKAKYHSESERLKRELALLLSKKTAISSLLGKQISPKKSNIDSSNQDDIFKLPALPQKEFESESSESEDETSNSSIIDMHSVDVESDNFKNLPVKEKYDLLLELKETRKMNSWGRLHELPKKSDNFSDFQMQRLLKRRKVQECIQETEREMGDIGMSLNDLESLLNEEGIDTKMESLPTRRIASNNDTRFLLINNVREALAQAKKRNEAANDPGSNKTEEKPTVSGEQTETVKKDELAEDLENAIKMSLETSEENTSGCAKTDDSWTSVLSDTDYSESEEDQFQPPDNMSTAKAYIMQYTDLTHTAIDNLVAKHKRDKAKSKVPNVDELIKELKQETCVIGNVELSSSDDELIEVDTESVQNINKESNVELNTTNENLVEHVDATQASVLCIDDAPEIISLDTSTEDDAKTTDNVLKSDRREKEEIETENEDLDEDLQRAIQMSLECVNNQSKSSETVSETSDDDFEEVTSEGNSQPVVEITLNVGDAPEDDIFADIFAVDKESVKDKNGSESLKLNNKPLRIKDYTEASTSKAAQSIDTKIKCIEHTDIVKEKRLSEPDIVINQKVTETENSIDKNRYKVSNARVEISPTKTTENPLPTRLIDSLEKKVEEPENNLDISSKPTIEKSQPQSAIDKPVREPISVEQLNTIAEELRTEEQDLVQEKGRLDRIGRNITEQMTKEAQELLQVFGIPYIVAPMEAEAQCAFLESVHLTDGTITDDSDIWLFGGRTVYKNFFNQKKHVLQFLAERIEKSFNLTREQLILLALLVGSDYTTGVTGVGPVTAIEILASFPFNKKQLSTETSKQARYLNIVTGLQEFKKWVRAGKRTDNSTLKKKLKNVTLTEDFPSVRVVQAYLEPNVEESEEKFTWGELDITVLRDYAKAKFGWSQNKLDEIINPVLKRMTDRKSQRSMQDYFKRKIDFENLEEQMSKRVKAAVQKMGPDGLIEETADAEHVTEGITKTTRKRKVAKKTSKVVDDELPGQSKPKVKKATEDKAHSVEVVSQLMQDGKSGIEIMIPKTDRVQEIIPQREKDKQNLLQNKLKAIELFRKTKIDHKKKTLRRRPNLPKEKAELSESSDSD